MNQGFPQGKYHPHTLHDYHMVVKSPGQNRTLRHTPGSKCAASNDYQQHHNLMLHFHQAQAQEAPQFVFQITHISRLTAWIPSRLSWTPELQGREQCLLYTSFPKESTRTNNQEVPTVFDTSARSALWESGLTHSINIYLEIYT